MYVMIYRRVQQRTRNNSTTTISNFKRFPLQGTDIFATSAPVPERVAAIVKDAAY